jgi:hypothetical protein
LPDPDALSDPFVNNNIDHVSDDGNKDKLQEQVGDQLYKKSHGSGGMYQRYKQEQVKPAGKHHALMEAPGWV